MAYEEHIGYKAFNGKRQNQIGMFFDEGKTYGTTEKLVVGMHNRNNMNGYHISEELANVFRFVDIANEGIEVAKVKGFGECQYFEDEYNGYYDMYVCQFIQVNKFLKRDEYIQLILLENEFEILKFIKTFPMNEEEKKLFITKFSKNIKIVQAMLYYQYNEKDIYTKTKSYPILKKEYLYEK